MKVMIIEFTKYDACGQIYSCNHYYVNGKRMSGDGFSQLRGLLYDTHLCTRHMEWCKKGKDGICKHYIVNHYEPKNHCC